MRKLVLALAVAGSALAIASPASAQYHPGPYDRGGYGYNRGYADPSGLQQRIHNVLRSIEGVRPNQRDRIYSEAIRLDRGLRYAARNGLSPREHQEFDHRIHDLELFMADARMSERRRYGYRRY